MVDRDAIDLGDTILVLAGLAGPRFSTFLRFEEGGISVGYVDKLRDPDEHRIWLAGYAPTGYGVEFRLREILGVIRRELAARLVEEGGSP